MAPPKKKVKATGQPPVDTVEPAQPEAAQETGPEVSLAALQQLEEKKKGISRQLKQVESQVYLRHQPLAVPKQQLIACNRFNTCTMLSNSCTSAAVCCRYTTLKAGT